MRNVTMRARNSKTTKQAAVGACVATLRVTNVAAPQRLPTRRRRPARVGSTLRCDAHVGRDRRNDRRQEPTTRSETGDSLSVYRVALSVVALPSRVRLSRTLPTILTTSTTTTQAFANAGDGARIGELVRELFGVSSAAHEAALQVRGPGAPPIALSRVFAQSIAKQAGVAVTSLYSQTERQGDAAIGVRAVDRSTALQPDDGVAGVVRGSARRRSP